LSGGVQNDFSSMKCTAFISGLSLIVCMGALHARLFQPQDAVPHLAADDNTVGLYEFRKAEFEKKEMPDVSGKNASGKISGNWAFVTPEELVPIYQGAGKVLAGSETERSEVSFNGLADLASGAYSVDVVLRWNRGGGNFLRVGKGVVMGVLHRGPGNFMLRVPVKGTDGTETVETFESKGIYEIAPTVRFDDFYVYSLTYDGAKTYEVFIDGVKVFTANVSKGEVVGKSSECAVGDVAKWNSVFNGGEIAAVRVSKGVRTYVPQASPETKFDKAAVRPWTFDAGTATSPLANGAIRLAKGDAYDATRGYGWLGSAIEDFDAPIMADRYAATPDIALEKGSYRLVDALHRDGVVVPPGAVFRIDVPDGQYWVSAELGHNRGASTVSAITANGTVLGEKLAMSQNTFGGHLNGRTARGLVTAAGGKGIQIEAKAEGAKAYVPVKSIEVFPYAPLPVVLEKQRLVWKGKGGAPAELDLVSDALAVRDFSKAADEAKKIRDPLVQANVLACVLGTPKLPKPEDIVLANELRQLLLKIVREQPDNKQAAWMLDSTERFRHALIAYVDEGGNDVIAGSRFSLWLGTGNQGLQLRLEDPQYWQGHFLAGAGIWQNGVQNSAFDTNSTTDKWLPDKMGRLQGFDAPGKIFREVIAGYPDFRIARIMLGERLPAEKNASQPPANAPHWAVMQNLLLRRVTETIHYWVNERMDSRGLLGGGLGDDVEALRWWNPSVVLADDATTIEGWRRMAEAAWGSTGGLGYSRGMDDVEHSAEPTADPLPMLALMNHNTLEMAKTEERLTKTLPIFRDIWTTTTPEGYRMFKGYHFNATQITREGDVPYNIRAIKPLLWAAWVAEGKNKELQDLMVAYARSWRDAIMSEFDGKPQGIVPTMIKLDRKRSHEKDAPDWGASGYQTYKYPAAYVGKVYDLLLAAYEMSGDKSFLEPIQFALGTLRKIPDSDLDAAKYPNASFDWAIRSGIGFIGVAGGDYRSITGDKSFDDVLLRIGPPIVKFRILAEKAKTPSEMQAAIAGLEKPLSDSLEIMNSNPELRTEMIQSTDRIYVAGSLILTSMSTGATLPANDLRGGEIVWPSFPVTWRGTDGEIAALVTEASPEKLEVLLYNFSEKPKSVRPWVWRLAEGNFAMKLSETDASGFAAGKPALEKDVAITGRGQELSIELPARTPLRLSLVKK
jgi:hypothetical protein